MERKHNRRIGMSQQPLLSRIEDPMQFLSYLEYLYNSENKLNWENFYKKLRTPTDAIEFSHSRQNPHYAIKIINNIGYPKLVVVMPTPDLHNRITKDTISRFGNTCIVLVESSGKYFNFAKSMNIGIQQALQLDPKWILLSNNDVYPIDNIEKFEFSLKKYQPVASVPVLNEPHIIRPIITKWFEPSYTEQQLMKIISYPAELLGLSGSLISNLVASRYKIFKSDAITRFLELDNMVLNSIVYQSPISGMLKRVSDSLKSKGKYLVSYINIQPVGIFAPYILEEFNFDETFINHGEDSDLSIRMKLNDIDISSIKITFGGSASASLGLANSRMYRCTLFGLLYMGFKLKNIYKIAD